MEHERNTVEFMERSEHDRWFWPLIETVTCAILIVGTLLVIRMWV